MKRFLTFLCLFCCLALLLPIAATAEDVREVRIYAESAPKDGVLFHVYSVGTLSDSKVLIPNLAFSTTPTLPSLEDENLASTLAAYAQSMEIPPYVTVETDASGHAAFSPERDEVFLIVGEGYAFENYFVEPQPILVAFPNEPEEGIDIFSFTVSPKLTIVSLNENEKTERHVLKVWDDEHSQKRPQEIVVSLLCDGKRIDTATLSSETDWAHTFRDLDAAHVYTVVEEDVPEGYSVSISRESKTLVVKNTLTSSTSHPPKEDPPEHLPQTGMVIWPLCLFCILSLVCLCIGLSRPPAGRKEK